MSKGTLFDKVWDAHTVGILPSGQTQLFIGLHLIHEVTSPQAFSMLRDRNLRVLFPERTIATVDHIVPTTNQARPFRDDLAEEMMQALEKSCQEHGITFYNIGSGSQGIVHVIAPELGLTQPGMTIACGDSHTSTHGAFGAIAFGIGTSQVRDVLASQTLALSKLKVRRIEVNGTLRPGVYAKDVILHIIRKLGVKGGVGYAYEYGGSAIAQMNMEERMTICNMSIEGGARCGYINPDQVTFDYLKGRDFAPQGADWEKAVAWWQSITSDPDAEYDDVVVFNAAEIAPTVTWGITPGQGIGVDEKVPTPEELPEDERAIAQEAYLYMDLQPGAPLQGTKVDVCFIGSCTNGRITDLREAAKFAKGRHVAEGIKAFVVPGSERVKKEAEAEGLHEIFESAGFEWREPGCSMCLAMNPDKLQGRQLSASSSNRNFKGRQGSASGRTLLMSPAMVVAAAITGRVTDVRELI
ncbi:3-isopropylmalate dehydratase large subunit [Leptothermofonsia sichuanensis E412]|uniref:3-isopropylmalate dehydratase large subunit n=1 Tax=Leptothermofonsia sichuanensis TaxID=2917832 RepID=UPI001CA64C09|nr:3-isopropylmalate dehydratase large subunit [Leptothermofonsia sichuanensis]QZZ18563.1 3-isopropylmalate dehydratase large subunit [Leptothermofonsia sichuanensis E412]